MIFALSLSLSSNFLQNVYRRKHDEIFSYPLFTLRHERLSCANTLS